MLKFILTGLAASLRHPLLAINRRRGKLVRPLFLGYAVTWRCNSRCIMCDTWKSSPHHPLTGAPELSPQELDDILARNAEFLLSVKKVGLTGGEPFLRDDLAEIVRALHKRLPRARMSLVSNGLLTERVLKTLEEIRSFFPELVFSVSLDGIGQVHDKVRGIPGAYDKALATIKGAQALGFTVTSGMTASSINFDQIQPLADLLAGMGVDFSCNLQERGANFHTQGQTEELAREHRERILSDLAQFSHHFYMDNLRRQLEGAPRTLPCYSGFTSYFLTPFGEVTVCNLLDEPLGDLRQRLFREIADAPETWQRRQELASCTCWSQCEVKHAAASAPWHVLKWLAQHPNKLAFCRHYAKKTGMLPR